MFYDQLVKVCKEKNTSPSAVTLAAGLSKTNVTCWRKGQAPKLDTIVKLAEQLNVSPKELIPEKSTETRERGECGT